MRLPSLVAIAVIGCYVAPPEQPPGRRPLVTDQLPYYFKRDAVRAWYEHNDWCMRRTWPTTDEFVVCNRKPYLNESTPPMYTLARYDAEDRVVAFATFTPVPCRMHGHCDQIRGRTVYASEHDFVDHSMGLHEQLANRGRAVEPHEEQLPSMQQRMFDALVVELHNRFADPTWQDPRRYGMTWSTRTSEVGLFVAGSGGWIVETHELSGAPPGLTGASAR
jgi:hypothetical protein